MNDALDHAKLGFLQLVLHWPVKNAKGIGAVRPLATFQDVVQLLDYTVELAAYSDGDNLHKPFSK
jgi:hypothetical protein